MTIRWVDTNEFDAIRHLVADARIDVLEPGMWENDEAADILHWFAVVDSDGIFAYTPTAREADELAAYFEALAVRETIDEHVTRQ